jgi:hypothetical protein
VEAITQLVTDSLVRHGFDRPVDPRRLQWSRWFRCDSTHSLLVVPSKPGIFALAEEIMDLGPRNTTGASNTHLGTDAFGSLPRAEPRGSAERSSATASSATIFAGSKDAPGISSAAAVERILGGAALQRCNLPPKKDAALAAEAPARRMLAVLQFSEDDDMAYTLDRMFTCLNPMRARLASGACFLRFVVIEDQTQRRAICSALNQWMLSSAEKTTGIPANFSSSLEALPAEPHSTQETTAASAAEFLDSGAAKNLHCPHSFPSGF